MQFPIRTSVLVPLALALILAATAALLVVVLRAPAVWTLDIGAPGDAYYIENAFAGETSGATSLRWTRAETRLLLHGAAAGPLSLDLRLYRRSSDSAAQPWPLRLQRADQTLALLNPGPGWRVYRVLLPAGALLQPDANTAPLVLSSPTFQPGPRDPRDLGLALDWLRLSSLDASAAPIVSPLLRALWLTWMLGLGLGLAAWSLRILRGKPAPLAAGWALGLAGAAASSLLYWAWRDPHSLAWAAPTQFPLAAGLSLSLALAWLLEARLRIAPPRVRIAWLDQRVVLPALFVIAHCAMVLPLPLAWRGASACFVLAAPGALSALLVFRHERDTLTKGFLALCGGLALAPLFVLALHALPGPLPWWLLLAVVDTASLVLGLQWFRATSDLPAADRAVEPGPRFAIGLVLALAAALRLPFLGSAEFQGDEAYALLLSKGVLHGQDDILLLHMKGPVEALLPAGPLVLLGQINEWVARLPFATAGLSLLLGIYLLARALFAPTPTSPREDSPLPQAAPMIGLLAAVILALDGFLIGFSRIVQYQSMVMLMALAAVWCCWRFYAGVGTPRRYLISAVVFAAVSMLAHYDGVFALPTCAWLVLAGGRRRGWRGRQWLREPAVPVFVGLLLLLSFYLPFVLHEHFARTADYLQGRTGQGGWSDLLYNNLGSYYQLMTFYTTTYQVQALIAVLAGGLLVVLLRYSRPRALGVALALLFVAACALVVVAPDRFVLPDGLNWAIIAFALPLGGLALAPALPAPLRLAVIWFSVPFLAMAFLIGDPRTHFYTVHLPAALLIALFITRALLWLRRGRFAWLQALPALGGLVLLLLAAPYAQLAFVRQTPEYYRLYPATLVELYRPAGGERLPEDGFFGFPHRDGWKVVGELYRRGLIEGDYDSNQKLFLSGWYTRGAFKCIGDPDYFFVALFAEPLYIPPGYHLFGSVLVDDIRAIDIYSRAPVPGPPQVFRAGDDDAGFDAQPVTNFPIRRLLSGVAPQQRLETAWQRGVSLRGYDLDRSELAPGQTATLTFYWRATQALEPGYEPFVEVRNQGGQAVAAALPHCSTIPAEAWSAQYVNDTPFTITATAALPPGDYTLHVGLRRPRDGNVLPLADGANDAPFATLRIRAP